MARIISLLLGVIFRRSKSEYTPKNPEIVEAEVDEVLMNPEDEFYTLEELDSWRITPWHIW